MRSADVSAPRWRPDRKAGDHLLLKWQESEPGPWFSGKVVTKYLSLQNGFLPGISSGKLYLLKGHIQGFLKDFERSMMVVLLTVVLGDGAMDASVTSSNNVKDPCPPLPMNYACHFCPIGQVSSLSSWVSAEGWLAKPGLGVSRIWEAVCKRKRVSRDQWEKKWCLLARCPLPHSVVSLFVPCLVFGGFGQLSIPAVEGHLRTCMSFLVVPWRGARDLGGWSTPLIIYRDHITSSWSKGQSLWICPGA